MLVAYLKGRLVGDAVAALQGSIEFQGGSGAAAAGLGTGPGALVISTGGAFVAGHGAAVGAAATADGGTTIAKLIKLEGLLKATAPQSSGKSKSSSPSNTKSSSKYDANGKIKNGPEFSFLKDHAKRHSMHGDPVRYYNSAVEHTQSAKWKFNVRHDGMTKRAYITPLKNGKYLFTSGSTNGKRIFTHMEVDAQYLSNKGITLPKK